MSHRRLPLSFSWLGFSLGLALFWALAGALLGACGTSSVTSGIGSPCTRTSDCQKDLTCGPTGFCTGPDSGVPIEGGFDANDANDDTDVTDPGDAGSLDAGTSG